MEIVRKIWDLSKQDPQYSEGAEHLERAYQEALSRRVKFPETLADLHDPFTPFSYYNAQNGTVEVNGEIRHLTPAEKETLELLARNSYAGKITSQIEIKNSVVGESSHPTGGRIAVRRLRLRIEPDPSVPRRIISLGGSGYLLRPEIPTPPPAP